MIHNGYTCKDYNLLMVLTYLSQYSELKKGELFCIVFFFRKQT